MKRFTLILLFLVSGLHVAFSQTGKDFWFVAPQITATHGDKPIYLRMSAFGLASTVTISQPANTAFNGGNPIVINVPANSTRTYNLESLIGDIENSNANVVDNKGLHIVATENITIYYEVLADDRNHNNSSVIINSDIFVLKGKNALGTKFYTPFQNQLSNCFNDPLYAGIQAESGIDIVATEDNTTVKITPTRDVVGHPAASGMFQVFLPKKGSTYNARAVGKTGPDHLTGTYIESDKPIAVTTNDDSVVENDGLDLAGDQLVPIDVVGTDYIVVKGQLVPTGGNLGDRVIIVPTVNYTKIFINGVDMGTFGAGSTLNYQVNGNAEYISASAPIYVFHLSGFGNEVGGALLPPILCTGSKQVSFFRDTNEPFWINLLVKAGGEADFTFKNTSTNGTIALGADKFAAVPNTGGAWMYARIDYSGQAPENNTYTISNSTTEFHLGLINGKASGAGARYGYFSDYGGLEGGIATATPSTVCASAVATINLVNSVGLIQWQDSIPGQIFMDVTNGLNPNSTTYTTPTMTAGVHYFRALLKSSAGCLAVPSNTVAITVQAVSNGGTTSADANIICQNTSTTVHVSGYTGTSIQWQDSTAGVWANVTVGSGATTANYITANLSKTSYFRAIITNGVCSSTKSPTIKVTMDPTSNGGTSSVVKSPICQNETATLSVIGTVGAIQWQQSPDGSSNWSSVSGGSGANSATYTSGPLSTTTFYRVSATNGVCTSANSNVTQVVVQPLSDGGLAVSAKPVICQNTSTSVSVSGHNGTIQWQDSTVGGTWKDILSAQSQNFITPSLTQTTFYRAKITNGVCAFALSDTAVVKIDSLPKGGTAKAVSPICQNNTTTISVTGNRGTVTSWQQSSTGAAPWTTIAGATSPTYTTPGLQATTYYRAQIKNGICASPVASASVKVTVDLKSKGGTAAALQSPICKHGTAILNLNGNTGLQIQWQDSISGGSWQNVTGGSGDKTASYTTGSLTGATYYRALVANGVCASDSSNIQMIAISDSSIGGKTIAGNSPICADSSSSVSVKDYRGAIQWEQSPSGLNGSWTNVVGGIGADSSTFVTGKLSGTTYYRVLIKNEACSPVASDSAIIVVSPPTVSGSSTSNPPLVCAGSTAELKALGIPLGQDIQWQQSSDSTVANSWVAVTGGSGANTDTYTTNALTNTTYFRAFVKSGACDGNVTFATEVKVDPMTNGGKAETDKDSVCFGSGATIKLNSDAVTSSYRWQESKDSVAWNDVNPLVTTPTFSTPSIEQTMFYRAVVQSGSKCPVDTSAAVKVHVDSVSVGGTANAISSNLCKADAVKVFLSGSYRGAIQWQQSSDSLAWSAISGATDSTYQPTADKTIFYRAILTSGVCKSDSTQPVKIHVDSTTSKGMASLMGSSPICKGGNVTLKLEGSKGDIQWKQSPDGLGGWIPVTTGLGATSSSYNTGALSSTTYYHAVVKNGVCSADTSAPAILVKVDPTTDPGIVTPINSPKCAGNTITLEVKNETGTIQWQQFNGANWVNVVGGTDPTKNQYTTPLLTKTTEYRVNVTSGVCPPIASGPVKAVVHPKSDPGKISADEPSFCGSDSTTIRLKDKIGSVKWQQSADNKIWSPIVGLTDTSYKYQTPILNQTTYYKAIVTNGVCPNDTSDVITVTINTASVGGNVTTNPDSVCNGGTSDITLNGSIGTIVKWHSSINPTDPSSWTELTGVSGVTIKTPKLSVTTYFRATVMAGTCPSNVSDSGRVAVRVLSDFTAGKDSFVCQGNQFYLMAKGGFTNYLWNDGAKGQKYLVTQPGTYTVTAKDKNSCDVSATVKIDVCKKWTVPNVITPNGDNLNEAWIIQGLEPNTAVEIYNRWGTVVYTVPRYNNDWKGENCSDGVYYYIISKPNGEKETGYLQIIR